MNDESQAERSMHRQIRCFAQGFPEKPRVPIRITTQSVAHTKSVRPMS